MGKLTEPDDVDLFVGGVEPDAKAAEETARLIEECKKHPDYLRRAASAKQSLAAVGISPPDYGLPDAASLLDHWRRCVADLTKIDSDKGNGQSANKPDLGADPGLADPTEKQGAR
jgi:hypothetical protein